MDTVRIQSAVQCIEGKVREYLAGYDSRQRVRPRYTAESQEFEQAFRGRTQCQQRRTVERVSNPHPLERPAQRITQRGREALARLRVILQVLQHSVGKIQVLPTENRELPRLVIADLVPVDAKPKLQRPVKHVGLCEREQYAARQISQADLNLQRLAQTKKVVGRIA